MSHEVRHGTARSEDPPVTGQVHDPVSRVSYSFDPHGADLIVYTWLEPGGGLPAHLHPRQVERWSVLEGVVEFELGSSKRVIGPADGEVVVEPNTRHGLRSASDREARLKTVVVPALGLQSFLEESAAAAQEGLFTPRGLPRGLRGARWAARFLKKHREETVMLSPPPVVQRALIALLARDA
jgi:quercetin dioxygenase-like cupin family protein